MIRSNSRRKSLIDEKKDMRIRCIHLFDMIRVAQHQLYASNDILPSISNNRAKLRQQNETLFYWRCRFCCQLTNMLDLSTTNTINLTNITTFASPLSVFLSLSHPINHVPCISFHLIFNIIQEDMRTFLPSAFQHGAISFLYFGSKKNWVSLL